MNKIWKIFVAIILSISIFPANGQDTDDILEAIHRDSLYLIAIGIEDSTYPQEGYVYFYFYVNDSLYECTDYILSGRIALSPKYFELNILGDELDKRLIHKFIKRRLRFKFIGNTEKKQLFTWNCTLLDCVYSIIPSRDRVYISPLHTNLAKESQILIWNILSDRPEFCELPYSIIKQIIDDIVPVKSAK